MRQSLVSITLLLSVPVPSSRGGGSRPQAAGSRRGAVWPGKDAEGRGLGAASEVRGKEQHFALGWMLQGVGMFL